MGRCRDPLCVGSDGRRTRYNASQCADGDFLCWRTGCTAWVDSNDCEDDEDEDEDGHAYALDAAAKLEALAQSGPKEWSAPDEATRGRIVGLLAQIQKAAAKSRPTLRIDVDALLADFASTVDVDMDYMEGFERFE